MSRARPVRLRGLLALFVVLTTIGWHAQAPAALRITLASVETGDVSIRNIQLEMPETDGRAGRISLGSISAFGRQWSSVVLVCGQMRLSDGLVACRQGRLNGLGPLDGAHLELDIDTLRRTLTVHARVAGGRVDLRWNAPGQLSLTMAGVRLEALDSILGQQAEGIALTGQLEGRVARAGARWSVDVKIRELAFSDASGMHAAEDVALSVSATAKELANGRFDWTASLAWDAGDLFWNPVLVSAGWTLSAGGRLQDRELHLANLRVSGPGLEMLEATARVDMDSPSLGAAQARFEGADLAQLVPNYLLPVILPDQAERWRVAGTAAGDLAWHDGALQAARLILEGAGFSYLGQRFRVGPIHGNLPWKRGQTSRWRIDVDALNWQALSFAPFTLQADAAADHIELAPVRLPLLDGAIVLEALEFRRAGDQWLGLGSLYSEPIGLPALTQALEWPGMDGTVSIAVPGFSVSPDRIGLDGALVISVFDGYVQATGLEVSDPFGLLPRLTADLSAEHLDLAQLTQTFSFGSVSGFIDADVNDLVLAKWKPIRFDASVRSSSGDYRRRISQRAVENITALGGAGAMAAVQRSVLRLFNDFGYREIGLSCQLRGNVCQMAGLDGAGSDAEPFRVVAGGGIPALDVIGYNRRVDWAELIERLRSAISNGAEPIVK